MWTDIMTLDIFGSYVMVIEALPTPSQYVAACGRSARSMLQCITHKVSARVNGCRMPAALPASLLSIHFDHYQDPGARSSGLRVSQAVGMGRIFNGTNRIKVAEERLEQLLIECEQ